jgi:hypothetical protein
MRTSPSMGTLSAMEPPQATNPSSHAAMAPSLRQEATFAAQWPPLVKEMEPYTSQQAEACVKTKNQGPGKHRNKVKAHLANGDARLEEETSIPAR